MGLRRSNLWPCLIAVTIVSCRAFDRTRRLSKDAVSQKSSVVYTTSLLPKPTEETSFTRIANSTDSMTEGGSTATTPETSNDFIDVLINGWTLFPSIIADWLDKKIAEQKDGDHCREGDLTDDFALILQVILGFLSFAVLVLKRFCEPKEERRSWLVWSLDTSKQGFSMMLMHLINVYMSETSSKIADPCTFYLTSFLLDSSIGLFIIWLGLKMAEWTIERYSILGGLPFGAYDVKKFRSSQQQQSQTRESGSEKGSRSTSRSNSRVSKKDQQNSGSSTKVLVNNKTPIIIVEDNDINEKEVEEEEEENNQMMMAASSAENNTNFGSCIEVSGDTIHMKINGQSVATSNNTAASPKKSKSLANTQPKGRLRICHSSCLSLGFCQRLRVSCRRISFPVYSLQTFVYLIITIVEKVITTVILRLESLQRFYIELRTLLTQLVPIKQFEIALVMFVIPFILNCLMFWVIDNILMKSVGCLSLISKKLGQYSWYVMKGSAVGVWRGAKRVWCCACPTWDCCQYRPKCLSSDSEESKELRVGSTKV